MNASDKYYYDNTTEDFFRELNHGQQNNLTNNSSHTSDKAINQEDNFEQNLRLTHSSPRFRYNNARKRSNSVSRMISSSSYIAPQSNNQTENIDNDNLETKNEITSRYYKTNSQKWNSNDNLTRNASISNLNNSNDTFNRKYTQYHRPPIFHKSKYNNAKTQTPTKKNLEISDSISVDYYYSNVISFEVDPQSLHASFHKRTKHRRKHENNEPTLNFLSKHIPNCEPKYDKMEKNPNSSKHITISSNFDEEMEKSWQSTLHRFRSMKSTKAVFNSIRLTELKHYKLTQIIEQRENEQNNKNDESNLLKFQLFSQGNDQPKSDTDIIHLYSWHHLSIDPKKIVLSLTQLYHINFCKSNLVENDESITQDDNFHIFRTLEECICSILKYTNQWIILFPTEFVPIQSPKSNNLTFFADDLVNLIILIISSSPQFKKPAMTILAVIFFIYNGEANPMIFSHFPCLKAKKTAKESLEASRLIDLQIDPQILAKHFTYYELQFLRNVSRIDIIDEKKWNKSEPLQAMFKRFNDTCSFILSSIVKFDKESQIQRSIFWINVMNESSKLRNYQLMFEIETALSSPLLKDARSRLPIAVNLKFDKLKSFLYSKSYKDDVKNHREVCIPFFGNVFKKVAKIFGNSDAKSVGFVQMNECVNAVEFLLSEWGTQYVFDLDSSLLKAVYELEGKIVSVEELKEIQT